MARTNPLARPHRRGPCPHADGRPRSPGAKPSGRPWPVVLAALLLAASPLVQACGSTPEPAPEPGDSSGAAPALGGATVMVLPVQRVSGLPRDAVDAEIAFALESRGRGTSWVWPDDLREALERSPSLDARLADLPVDVFLRAEVQRVGDPLYGILRRLAALTDAGVALVPVAALYRPATDSLPGAAEVAAAVLHVRTGRVLWFGVVEGAEGGPADPRVLASAVDALARRVLPGG